MDDVQARKPGMLRRIVAFPLTLLIVESLAIGIGASLISALLLNAVPKDGPVHFLGAVFTAMLTVLVYLGCRRWIEWRANDELPAATMLRELPLGLLIGAALFTLATALVALMGGIRIDRVNGVGALGAMLAMAVTSGTIEEILFRGILLRHLETMLGTWAALFITSALFGAAHLSNPGASLFAAFAIAMEAGILLGAAYLWTRRLWVPIGIHAAWNFTQGWVFSVPVSGGKAPEGLLITVREGPDWLTGGAFGLEASVIAMIVATGAGLILLARVVRQGGIRPPMWVKK